MSIEINGKVYRNLPEQVEKNKDDIEKLKNYYPFSGPYATTDDIPEDLLIDTGKYLIGANEPYTIYQYNEENESFTDLGTFADPEDYINKTGNVTGITGAKQFNLTSSEGSPWNNESLTINYARDKAIRLYGSVDDMWAADYNETNINAYCINMHGAGNSTQSFGSTAMYPGYLTLTELPYEDGANVIQIGSKYGYIGVYTHYDNEEGSGIGKPSGVLQKDRLIFMTGPNSSLLSDYRATSYQYGGIHCTNYPEVNPTFDISIANSSRTTCYYDFKYFTGGGHKTVATIDDITAKVPDAPTVDGTYTLKVTVSNGTPTYSWVLDN